MENDAQLEDIEKVVNAIGEALLIYELSGEQNVWDAIKRGNPDATPRAIDSMAEVLYAVFYNIGAA